MTTDDGGADLRADLEALRSAMAGAPAPAGPVLVFGAFVAGRSFWPAFEATGTLGAGPDSGCDWWLCRYGDTPVGVITDGPAESGRVTVRRLVALDDPPATPAKD